MSIVGSEQWMYSAGAEFYDFPIEQSLRFNDDDSAYLSRTPASTSNRTTWTWSGWIKRGNITGSPQDLFSCSNASNNGTFVRIRSDEVFQIFHTNSGSTTFNYQTTAVLRDVGSWYSLIVAYDSTESIANDRIKMYINGQRVTSFNVQTTPSLNEDSDMNRTVEHQIGGSQQLNYFDGYMADVTFIDGQQLEPTSFGQFKSGIWIPKDTSGLTFGTNGFRLEFGDSAAIGDDTSGNTNDWTVNNLVASDVVLDSPTNNFATLNSSLPDTHFNSSELSEGNLFYNEGEGNNGAGRPTATFSATSGKWYWEVQVPSQQNHRAIGFTRTDNIGKGNVTLHGTGLTASTSVVGIDLVDDTIDQVDKAGTHTQEASGLTGMSNNDIFGISVDLDGGTFQMYRNGSTYGSSYSLDDLSDWQVHGMTPTASGNTYQAFRFNFGQDSTFAGNTTAGGNADANGYGDFKYAPPSGYLSLCSANLPTGAIDTLDDETPEDYFNTVLYTGDGVDGRAVNGVGFKPDFVWIKGRSDAYNHRLYDVIRGATKSLLSDTTGAEQTHSDSLQSFTSDGFTLGTRVDQNNNGSTFASWNWKANGSGVSNTDGSITSTVSVGATSQQNWFSVVSYTGTGANATVGHGLGVAPQLYIVKYRNAAGDWKVYSEDVGNTYQGFLNDPSAFANTGASIWNNTSPTSSVFSIGTNGGVNTNGGNYIAYCFANAEGLCKVGKYGAGTGNSDGPFVYTGFRPAFILVKRYDGTMNWAMWDNERLGRNPTEHYLIPDLSNAEGSASSTGVDFLSNGFKFRGGSGIGNLSGANYIYLAIASQPFKYSNAR